MTDKRTNIHQRLVKCKFPTSSKLYSYRSLLDLYPGDTALVASSTGTNIGLVEVVEVKDEIPKDTELYLNSLGYSTLAWVFQKVDLGYLDDLVRSDLETMTTQAKPKEKRL